MKIKVTKTCATCNKVKTISCFNNSPVKGIYEVCKECRRKETNLKKEVPLGYKRCSRCTFIRPLTHFTSSKRSKDGLKYCCVLCKKEKDAEWFKKHYSGNEDKFSKWYRENPKLARISHKDWSLKNKYGISLIEYDALVIKHKNVCAICKQPETAKDKNGTVWRLSVDHCHSSNEIRGLLCNNCNTALGLLKDSVSNLEKAILYLRLHQAKLALCKILNIKNNNT